MAVKWIKTKYPGVRYYEHPTRKNGVNFDRYFAIRYQHQGKSVEEGVGWGTEEHDADEANEIRARLKKAAQNKKGPTSQAEERLVNKKKEEAEQLKKEKEAKLKTTFGQFFESVYLPQCKVDKKPHTAASEELLFRNWLKPVIGDLLFSEIGISHLDEIKSNMLAGKRPEAKKHPRDKSDKAKNAHLRRNAAKPMSARSIQYALAVIRQTWNRACAENPPLANGEWPGASKAFKKPKADNQRKRFLTQNEAATLLAALKLKSDDVHDMALLSLHCGLRAGELFKLTWDRVKLKKGELVLVDTKNGESRISYLTDQALAMLRQRSINCKHNRLVFLNTNNEPYRQMPATFARTVESLGLNDGITDDRDKIVFHSLRHTYASWLVENGASLPIVRDLLGHKTLIMTNRYSHVSAEAQKQAVRALNKSMQQTGANVVNLDEKRG